MLDDGAQAGIAGLVLAGGLSSRFGGGDKPLRLLGGKTLLAHVIERLAPQVRQMALSANGDPERFSAFGLPVLADEGTPASKGPLAGILAGLGWARRQTGCIHVLTVAGDTPFIPSNLSTRLAGVADDADRHIVVAASGGRRHPVVALWPVAVEDDLRLFLSQSETFSINAFLRGQATTEVEFSLDDGVDPFFNVNTPSDLIEAEELVRRLRP